MERRTARVTIADVARAVGVSTATVSFVLNNRTDGVRISDATRALVFDAATQLGYTPNVAARALRRSRTGIVTLLLATLRNPFYVDIATAAEHAIAGGGYDLNIVDSSVPGAKLRALTHLHAGGADGVIVATGHLTTRGRDYAALASLVRQGIPAVLTLDYSPEADIPAVRVDNVESAYLAARHLVRLGHRRVAFLAVRGTYPSEEQDDARADRYRGYRNALAEADAPFDPAWLVQGADASLETGHALMHALLRGSAPRPTAVVAFNDLMAIGAARACYEAGVNVPGEMAMVGIGGIAAGGYSVPALSTVDLPRAELGRHAAETLLGLLNGGKPPERERVLSASLHVRESCGGMEAHTAGGERG